MSRLSQFNPARHTITRDLTVGLVLTITLVFGLAGTANYFFSLHRDTLALYDETDEIMDNLASVLATPMWNLNNDELNKIVDVYRQSGLVQNIRLVDETNATLIPFGPRLGSTLLEMSRVIRHEGNPIGRVTVRFSDSDILAKQREIAVYTFLLFAMLTGALATATTFLLQRFLADPLEDLRSGLDIISGGDYTHELTFGRTEDMNNIVRSVNGMAREIAKREMALEENRNKLEILNQAILDIFSCSDTISLIRTTLTLTHKVCGVDRGWFLARRDSSGNDNEDRDTMPQPLVAVRGQVFESTEEEVEPHVGQQDNARMFSFPIKSRYRTVGLMTLSYDDPPDPTVTSLMKSLMSLVTLAMIRQSFIRETAFVSAELQVAEAVQRSMLPDVNRSTRHGVISYHYQPVLRVGGDWFNVIESKDGDNLFIIVGDVTGHGLAQGLVTTATAGALNVVESLIHQFGDEVVSSPAQILDQLDRVIGRIAGQSNLRMTAVAAHIDFKNMKLHICNAGHTFPLLLHSSSEDSVKAQSLAKKQQRMLGEDSLGGVRGNYEDATYDISDNDVLVFYTDGLTEALDRDGRAFLRPFQRHFAKSTERRSVTQVRDDLIRMFQKHVGEVPVKDDICLLVVGKRAERRTERQAAS